MAFPKKPRLLIVDDDDDTRDLLVDAFAYDFEVSSAPDAKTALELLERATPHVVLTDESLPGMRGAELARVVKERHPEVRVILFSGHTHIPGADAADRVLRKPLDLPELTEAVTEQMPH